MIAVPGGQLVIHRFRTEFVVEDFAEPVWRSADYLGTSYHAWIWPRSGASSFGFGLILRLPKYIIPALME